jgi:hypothetical protein
LGARLFFSWSLENLSKSSWSYVVKDGTQHVVAAGQTAAIRDGMQIQFGRVTGSVKA